MVAGDNFVVHILTVWPRRTFLAHLPALNAVVVVGVEFLPTKQLHDGCDIIVQKQNRRGHPRAAVARKWRIVGDNEPPCNLDVVRATWLPTILPMILQPCWSTLPPPCNVDKDNVHNDNDVHCDISDQRRNHCPTGVEVPESPEQGIVPDNQAVCNSGAFPTTWQQTIRQDNQ